MPDLDSLFASLREPPADRGRLVAEYRVAPRDALPGGRLGGGLDAPLAAMGIEALYIHQAAAVAAVRAGEHVVVVTGTSSGKSLCYMLPVLETWQADPASTALLVYPTKALAQDQVRAFERWQQPPAALPFVVGTYDGDTPPRQRSRLRQDGHLLLTNPDMLHQAILPRHLQWHRFLANLRYVVIDELHVYRGVFGAHLANVIRRLRRLCRHHGSDPRFICTSATIGNPAEHAQRLCGVPMTLIDRDGAPGGGRDFLFWNPPLADAPDTAGGLIGGARGSSLEEAASLVARLVREGVQTIAFVRTRLAAELICRSLRERLRDTPLLAAAVAAYRGGYRPEERREIERRLAAREVLAVVSTNALELGIDIGSLDACVLVGYPGSIASFRQQAGRAGRGRRQALVVLVADSAPMDQYLLAHPEYLFERNPEMAVVDPDNPHIVVSHLSCAASELPLTAAELPAFGRHAGVLTSMLTEDAILCHDRDKWYWASSDYPAAAVSLRNLAGPVFSIRDAGGQEIGTADAATALAQLHEGAVYLHGAETHVVELLDLDQRIATVRRAEVDYYTQSILASRIRIDACQRELPWRGGLLCFGDVTVTTTVSAYRKIRFSGRQSLGCVELALPPQELETAGLWWIPVPAPDDTQGRSHARLEEALLGIGNVLLEMVPCFLMCDPRDVGTVVDSRNLGRPALFFHDRYPGGMGFAERCLQAFPALLEAVAAVIADCACRDGCPSCVGAFTAFTAADRDRGSRPCLPGKAAAKWLLASMPPA